jgi:hypothetical protein
VLSSAPVRAEPQTQGDTIVFGESLIPAHDYDKLLAVPPTQPPLAPPVSDSKQTKSGLVSASQVQVNSVDTKLSLSNFVPALIAISAVGLAYLVVRFWERKQKSSTTHPRHKYKVSRWHAREFGTTRGWNKPATY